MRFGLRSRPCVDSTAPGLDAAPDSTLVDANEPEDANANAPDASDGGPAPDGATLTDGAASDGGPIVVTSGLASPSMLLLSNGNLFFYEIDTADIGEVSVNGGAVTRFEVGSSDPALTFTADANNIYWATVGGNVFQQGLTAASPLQIGTSVATEPYTLISDGTFVYWVEYLGNGRVRRIAVGGSTSDAGALTGELLYPSAIAFVGTQLYVERHRRDAVRRNDERAPARGRPRADRGGPRRPLHLHDRRDPALLVRHLRPAVSGGERGPRRRRGRAIRGDPVALADRSGWREPLRRQQRGDSEERPSARQPTRRS